MDNLIYLFDGYWRTVGEHQVHSKYPLVSGGPLPILAIVASYLYCIKIAGPRWMEDRKPYKIEPVMRLYNIMMSSISAYLFYRGSLFTRFGLDYMGCKTVGSQPGEEDHTDLGFIFFACKLIELLDTVFFVMRKKWSQCSKMHLFHHSCIIMISWVYFKLAPGGSTVLFPYLNTGVHTIMYAYYFLATFPSMRPYLQWKRYLTLLQIAQFVILGFYFSHQLLMNDCQYPRALSYFGLAGSLVFISLFCNFYYHAYLKGSKKKLENNNGTVAVQKKHV